METIKSLFKVSDLNLILDDVINLNMSKSNLQITTMQTSEWQEYLIDTN